MRDIDRLDEWYKSREIGILFVFALTILIYLVHPESLEIFTPMSVIFAVLIFFKQERTRKYSGIENQQKILLILKKDLEVIRKQSKDMQRDVLDKGYLPIWLIHRIDYHFYRRNLNSKINEKETDSFFGLILELSRLIDLMNSVINYLIENSKNEYNVPPITLEKIEQEIKVIEVQALKLKYDDSKFIELREILKTLSKAHSILLRKKYLQEYNKELKLPVDITLKIIENFIDSSIEEKSKNTRFLFGL